MEDTKAKKSDESKGKSNDHGVALSRVRTIMKSTANTGPIPHEGLVVVSKAIQLFIGYLAKGSHNISKSDKVTYEHLAKFVNKEEKLDFLLQTVPQKITIKEYKEILARGDNSSSDDENDLSDGEETEAK